MVGFFSDVVGRRTTILFSLIITVIGIAIALVFSDYIVKSIGILFWGTGADIIFAIGFTYVTEIIAEEDRARAYTVISLLMALGSLANPLFFFIFKNWFSTLLYFYGLGFLVVTIAFFFYVESPPIEIVSHSKDAKSAYDAFMRIADKNGVTDHGITEEEIQNIY